MPFFVIMLSGVVGCLCLMAALVIGGLQVAGQLGWHLPALMFWLILFAAGGFLGLRAFFRWHQHFIEEIERDS